MTTTTVAARLNGAGIRKACVVDDVYDPPTRDEFSRDTADQFLESVSRREDLRAALNAIKPDIDTHSDFDDATLANLWSRGVASSELQNVAHEMLFPHRLADLARMRELRDALTAINVDVVECSSVDDVDATSCLVFIDFYLGSGPAVDAKKRSRDKAQAIYQAAQKNDKPFIILMSSRSVELRAEKDDFRRESRLLAGLFGHMAKDEFKDAQRVALVLGVLLKDLGARHEIQHFVDALSDGANAATIKFQDALRDLSYDDYVGIQWLVLKDDGHPLGEYMLWLLRGKLWHFLCAEADVIEQRRALDKMSYDNFQFAFFPPTSSLAALYSAAIFEPQIGALAAHPRDPDNENQAYVRMGDVLRRDQEVRMVINAGCDVAFSPGSRDVKDVAIVMLHGTLKKGARPAPKGEVKTELVIVDGDVYRITWDTLKITSVNYSELWKWANSEGFERFARLSSPQALSIQAAFAANLSQVGLPVRPPHYGELTVELFRAGAGAKSESLFRLVGGAQVAQKAGEEHFALSHACVDGIQEAVKKLRVQLKEKVDGSSTEPGKPGAAGGPPRPSARETAQKELDKADALLLADNWIRAFDSFPLPKGKNGIAVVAQSLVIFSHDTFPVDYPEKALFSLNVRREPE